MTKTTFMSYGAFLCMAVALLGVTSAHASEVTGSLSSDTSVNAQTTGSIGGTVSSGNGSSGGGNRGGGNSSSNSPSGSVLGASTNNSQTPGFPNAGTSPEGDTISHPVWETILAFLTKIYFF